MLAVWRADHRGDASPPVLLLCAQAVDVLAASGMSCGTLELRAAAGKCSLRDVGIGVDGTVVQIATADSPGTDRPPSRWWPAVLH